MTEQDWLRSCEWLELWWHIPDEMLTDRKKRLFAAACCRRISHRLADSLTMQALQFGESFADGAVSDAELATACRQLKHTAYGEYPPTVPAVEWAAAAATAWVCHEDAFKVCRAAEEAPSVDGYEAVIIAGLLAPSAPPDVNALSRHACNRNGVVIPPEWGLIWQHAVFQRGEAVGRQHQAVFFRDIVGNPFRPVAVDPAWRTGTVVSLATAIYADPAFDRLPILADALEDAGCTNADILNHCRQPGEHVRGCWAVDLVLARN